MNFNLATIKIKNLRLRTYIGINEDEIKTLHTLLKTIENLNKKIGSKLDFFNDFQKYMKDSIEK